ncbi:Hypothetical protein Bdt_3392 [Bdellovibrio bacteriovorus str. Tiberius]|uniref:Uncharacterized protein n=1 Tax=Bdellovibrio bacteriovorus str. Tiberius TaxID=1069642 RepID=K7ZH35_BDEBC|nr:Hypothetical protein Bdt_3392 [Bdellovibrio bacteriovorus str. Tiberius]
MRLYKRPVRWSSEEAMKEEEIHSFHNESYSFQNS